MSLEAVIGAFASQVAELREATLLRVDGKTSQITSDTGIDTGFMLYVSKVLTRSRYTHMFFPCAGTTKELYSQELLAIESTVRALEVKLRDIKSYVKREKDAIPRSQAFIEAARFQRMHLDHIGNNLPSYLPSVGSPASGAPVLQELGGNAASQEMEGIPKFGADGQKKSAGAAAGPVTARRYITQEEFTGVSTYMRGRLTTDKVNAALDELATHAEANSVLITAARRNRPCTDRKHAMWLLHNFSGHDSLKGRMWVLESDLKSGAALRLDKTGKTILTLLRHLGRLVEVRVSVDGSTHLIYALVQKK